MDFRNSGNSMNELFALPNTYEAHSDGVLFLAYKKLDNYYGYYVR